MLGGFGDVDFLEDEGEVGDVAEDEEDEDWDEEWAG